MTDKNTLSFIELSRFSKSAYVSAVLYAISAEAFEEKDWSQVKAILIRYTSMFLVMLYSQPLNS